MVKDIQSSNNARNRRWNKTPKGQKCARKKLWKKRGLDMDTFYYVYPIYLKATHCERCGVELNDIPNHGNQKCMDHCHATGMFRNIVCRTCNMNVIPHIGKKQRL
jgi:hypothetical protein